MPGIVLSVGDTEMNLTDHNLHAPGAYLFSRWGAKQVKQPLQIKIRQGRGKESWRSDIFFKKRVVWEDLTEKVTFKQKPEGNKGMNEYIEIWWKSILDVPQYFKPDSKLNLLFFLASESFPIIAVSESCHHLSQHSRKQFGIYP